MASDEAKARTAQMAMNAHSQALADLAAEGLPDEWAWEFACHALAAEVVALGAELRRGAPEIEPGRTDGFTAESETMH